MTKTEASKSAAKAAAQRAAALVAAGFKPVVSDLVLTIPGLSIRQAQAAIAAATGSAQ